MSMYSDGKDLAKLKDMDYFQTSVVQGGGIVKAKMDILISHDHMASSHPCPHLNYCSTSFATSMIGHQSFDLRLLNINLNEIVRREEENVCLAQF